MIGSRIHNTTTHLETSLTVHQLQVLACLHEALQALDASDPLLRVAVGLRLALHLEAANDAASAAATLKQVDSSQLWYNQIQMIACSVSLLALDNPSVNQRLLCAVSQHAVLAQVHQSQYIQHHTLIHAPYLSTLQSCVPLHRSSKCVRPSEQGACKQGKVMTRSSCCGSQPHARNQVQQLKM